MFGAGPKLREVFIMNRDSRLRLHPRRGSHSARVRPLHRREASGDSRRDLLGRLRQASVGPPLGHDRLSPLAHPARRLRQARRRRLERGIEEGNGEEIPARERFDLRPRWQKFCVGVAGPVMNVITALAMPFALAMMVGVAGDAAARCQDRRAPTARPSARD